jgi:polysaccharide pyruvyl transferase WcaK-like protein
LTDLSPFEQIGIYKYFALVITVRFHDSIFCFKNFTPVIVFPENVTDVTVYGESKYKTLFKSFKLEKTNYIENKDNITARNLFDMHREAITNYKKNLDFIKTTLMENKEKYESFVHKSRAICME